MMYVMYGCSANFMVSNLSKHGTCIDVTYNFKNNYAIWSPPQRLGYSVLFLFASWTLQYFSSATQQVQRITNI